MKKNLLVLLLIFTFVTQGFATNCDSYSTLTDYGIIGENGFDYGNNSEINNNTISGTGNTPTPTGNVTTVNPDFPPLSPATFPFFLSITDKKNVSTISAGTYDKIEIDSNNLTTVFTGGTYYIKELKLSKNNTTAQLAPGDYYIEKISMTSNSFITVSPAGPVRIFIKESFQGDNEIGINANGSVENMMINLYSGAKIEIGNGNQGAQQTLNFNGVIYSPFANTEIQFGNNNNIQGAILSAGKIDVGNNTYFNYSSAVESAVIGAFGCTQASMVPIADWRMDECRWNGTAGEVIDSSANGYHATPKSDNASAIPQVSAQIINNGALFTRTSKQYVQLPTLLQNKPNFNDGFTVTAWAKFSSAGSWERIFDFGNGTDVNNIFLGREGTTNNLVLGIHDPGTSHYLTANNAISDTNWHFWAATCDGNGGCKLYKDGVKIAQSSTMKIPANVARTKNYIGKSNWSWDDYLTGGVDELKFFDAVLSDSQIQEIKNNESIGKSYDGTVRPHVNCSSPSLSTCWSEDFTDTNLTGKWTIISNQNYTPKVVGGKLMLTDTGGNIATGMTLAGHLPANDNYIQIEFEQNAYGGTGADGITLALSDANITPVAGAYGGSLGYAQKTGINGFAGGWLGFGIDEYGNFSNPTEGRSTGPGFIVDSFAIRGSGSGTTGYDYIAGTSTLSPGIDNTASATPAPGYKYRLSIDTRNAQTWVKAERDITGSGSSYTPIINWYNATQTAASPTDFRLSLTGSTGGSNNYHSVDNFILNAINCGTIGIIPSTPSAHFDAWDSFRSLNDRNISTKIVNKNFNLAIASLNSTNTALQDFNGTVCATIVNNAGNSISGWNKLLFTTAQSMTSTFNLNRAIGGSDSAGIKLYWKTNVDSTCPLVAENNSTIASDRFSVRPASFALTAPNAVAGVDFDLTFSAPLYGAATPSADYNEIVGSSFDVTVAEHNASCPIGTLTPSLGSGWAFSDGSKAMTTRYNEVGVLDVNISDTAKACAARYAKIDCDDANVNDGTNFTADLIPIGTIQGQITIKPDHFDVNATLANFEGGAFTYLSDDLNMSAELTMNVTAKNAEGNTTLNYDKNCYAKTTTLTLKHSNVPAPLSKILYFENLSGIDGNITKTDDIALSFTNSIFTQGIAPLQLDLNFDRDRSAPLNPFDFSMTSATATDTDSVTGTRIPLGTATFAYGRVRAYDITTNEVTAPNPIEFEVYSTSSSGYVSGMPQNVLKWYRNLNHNTAASGNVIRGGFTAGTTNIDVDTSTAPQNGIQIVTVTSAANQTVHLDISPWLWYSPKYSYDYSGGCTQHPCFNYNYTATGGVSGVSSGTFEGSDFNMAPANNITKKGVKVFR